MSRADPLRDPRIAKKEMIITRFKSAQQKRQKEREQGKPQTPPNVTKSPQTLTKTPQTVAKLPQNINKVQENATKSPDSSKSSVPRNKLTKKAKPQKSTVKLKEKRTEVKSPILIEDDNPEFYPEKLKRTPGIRKEFLKPKQKSTMIAKTNKRKFNTPKRGIKSPLPDTQSVPKCQSPVYSELSMAEVIRIVEDNDSLDDEDLMEILTCPSPVWWEEPPDEMYIEEAICSRKPDNASGKTKSPIRERCLNTLRNSAKFGNRIKTKDTNPETETLNDMTKQTQIKKDDKFIKKSKKLENVLGNIKNKASKDSDGACKRIKIEKLEEATSLHNANAKQPIEITSIISDTEAVIDTTDNISTNDKDAEQSDAVKDVNIETTNERKTKKLSESTEDSMGDFNSRNQELLLDLENMNIPVGDSVDMDSPDCVIINDDNSSKFIDVDALEDNDVDHQKTEDQDVIIKKDTEDFSNSNTEIHHVNMSNINTIDHESKEKSEIINNAEDEQTLVPKNMPPLIKCPKFECAVYPSPNSYKSISDDITESSSISGVDMMDTISDTNFKFITDDDIDDVSDSDNKNKNDEALADNEVPDSKEELNKNDFVKDENKHIELDEMAILTNTKDLKSKDAYITVYKIVSNDDTNQKHNNKFKNIPEYSSYVENLIQSENKVENTEDSIDNEMADIPIDSKGQLNSFFKKCKNAYRKRKRIENLDKVDIETNESRSKKSITVAQEENVKYCLKCSSIFDTEDCSYCLKTEKEADKSFMCDKCDFVGESTNNVNIHLEEHIADEDAKT